MNLFKKIIKKYFTSLTYFYRYLGSKIFVLVFSSLIVSVLDGFGLTMFLPLLQMVSGDTVVDNEKMGNLRFILDWAELSGISINIISILMFMIMFFILKGIASYLRQLYMVITQQSFIKDIRINLLRSLDSMKFKSFISSDVGQIQNTMSGEVDKVANAFTNYFASFQQAIMVFVYMGFAFFVDIQFAILVSIGGLLTNYLYKIIYERTKGASRKLTDSSNIYQGLIIQHVTHYKYLRATGMVSKHSHKLSKIINDIETARRSIGTLSGIGIASREPLLVIIVAAVIFVQIKILNGSMGAIMISLLFFYRALSSLVAMQQSWNSFLSVSGSLENMQSFQKELEYSKEKIGNLSFDGFSKEILFKKASFFFGEVQIIDKLSLTITKNQSIAFVGESGSGKTTLANLLCGLLDLTSGTITIDNVDLQQINKKSYQKRIGYITQEPVIFNDTLFNNITFWAEPTAENFSNFERAVEQAALTAFYNDLPGKSESVLGNNGITLSGGQKQRISIARELYKDIDILILDEATSALDSETEKLIQQSIENLLGNYTLIIVAHRLSTIRNVDHVVLLDKGKIIGEGTFDELVQKDPRFKKMVELQEL